MKISKTLYDKNNFHFSKVVENVYQHFPAVIIDNGSGFIKTGISGNDEPNFLFPSVVGSLKNLNTEVNYVGEESYSKLDILSLKYPIERGLIKNWDDMEKIWNYAFHNELKLQSDMYPVLLTETSLNSKQNREKTTEIMFETFHVPSMYLAMDAVLSLYALGRTTGVILDSGYGVTQAVPIVDGYAYANPISRLNLAGEDLTKYLVELLSERDHLLTTAAETAIVTDIKENLCYVSLDYHEEIEKFHSNGSPFNGYELPDGRVITVGNELFKCPEALFQPSLILSKYKTGVHQLVNNSILKCDAAIRNSLYNNIVLTGGTTMINGFANRLTKELTLMSSNASIKITSDSALSYSAWKGGSVVASLSSFQNMWVTKKEYEEKGSKIVHEKCL